MRISMRMSRSARLCLTGFAAGVTATVVICASAVAADPFERVKKKTPGATQVGGTEGSKDANKEEQPHPLAKALALARESQQALREVKDYKATFTKTELVKRKYFSHEMQMKFRNEPFSVYLKFQKAHPGREVLYVAGQNKGKLLAHEPSGLASIVGTLDLLPTSSQAMSEGRHPITEIGMHKMLDSVIRQWEEETKYDEIQVDLYPEAKLKTPSGERNCTAVLSQHPRPREEFKFHQTILYVDKETKFPIHLEQKGFPTQADAEPPIIERYSYTNIDVNVGFTDQDFSPKNKQYKF